jgi:nitrate reductase / nitrite oxidoreductase, alpha subunit
LIASGSFLPRSTLQSAHEFFRKSEPNAETSSLLIAKGRGWESAYRDRWRHDKVVRSTHGVNCTGSCSWNVYVKDGLITWESQAVDYPRTDPGRPDHEPRGCPRGASFSWYTYSPVRLKHPYVRGSLIEAWRAAKASAPDPVAAFAQRAPRPTRAIARRPVAGDGGDQPLKRPIVSLPNDASRKAEGGVSAAG